MEKALLLTGVQQTSEGLIESYQLLLGCNYNSAEYTSTRDRNEFIAEVSEQFATSILEYHHRLELSVLNGLRIDPTTGNHERIDRLEDSVVKYFSQQVCAKLQQRTVTIPIPSNN